MKPRVLQRLLCLAACAGAAAVLALAGGDPLPAAADRLCFAQGTASAQRPEQAPNPHWTREGCRDCHGADTTRAPADVSDSLCLHCHDGTRAKAEDHPVGRAFRRPDIRRPEGFPAPDNKLACLTCHDVLLGCRMTEQARRFNPAMLRGTVSAKSDAYCMQCHIPDAHQKLNPHLMLTHSGQPHDSACRFCHSEPIPAARQDRTGLAALRMDEPALCLGCHGVHLDFFEPGHIGAPATASVTAHMLHADRSAGLPAGDVPQLLPLAEGGRVVCSTCHNPHQAGLFVSGSVLDRGAMSWPKTTLEPVAFRLKGRELCSACHGY